jgi:hypothetical protein
MQYFYSGQIRNYRLQIIRAFSNFYIQYGTGELVRVPCRYGDPSRIAENVVRGGSENKVLSCPFITCYISGITMSSTRRQDPTFVDTVQVNERNYDAETQKYGNDIGNRYTVQRYMPVPYDITVQVDIWTNNLDQKEQLAEQILVLYNPSVEIQTSVNPLDWSVLSLLEMQDNITWTSRSIPQGTDNPIDVMTMTFKVPVWINPPAKVKRQAIIHEIITDIVDVTGSQDVHNVNWESVEFLTRIFTEPGDHGINIISENGQLKLQLTTAAGALRDPDQNATVLWGTANPVLTDGDQFTWNGHECIVTSSNVAVATAGFNIQTPNGYTCMLFNGNQPQFVNYTNLNMTFTEITPGVLSSLGLPTSYPGGNFAWWRLLQAYGNFKSYSQYNTAGSKLKVRLSDDVSPSGVGVVGYLDYDVNNQNQMIWRIDTVSIPGMQIANIDAVVNPEKTGPGAGLPAAATGQRYLLTADMAQDNISWGTLAAPADCIVEYDGSAWFVAWNPAENQNTTQWVFNEYSSKYLQWSNNQWQNFLSGLYRPGQWSLSI